MGMFLFVVSGIWSTIGALNLLAIWTSPTVFGDEPMTLTIGGVAFTTTFTVYFFPSLVLAALGVLIRNQEASLGQQKGSESKAAKQHNPVDSEKPKGHIANSADQTTLSSYPGAKYAAIGIIVLCFAVLLYEILRR